MTAQFSIPSGSVSLVAATPKTCIEIDQGANLPGEIIGAKLGSTYLTSATPISLLVELGTATATGTGTAATPKKYGQAVGTALDTVKVNHTVEPTAFTAVESYPIILPGGPILDLWPLGREFFLAVSSFNVLRLTASAACSVYCNLIYEV